MNIREIIALSKEDNTDIDEIKVSIKNKNELTFFEEPKEVYFGKLLNIPEEYQDCEIIEKSQICASSREERNGAYVLLIAKSANLIFEEAST